MTAKQTRPKGLTAVASTVKPKRLKKTWDNYVREAERPPLEFEITDGEVIEIHQPTGADSIAINNGLRLNDPTIIAPALFGENGDRILELWRAAPGSVFMELVADIFREFNLSSATAAAEEEAGDSDASSA